MVYVTILPNREMKKEKYFTASGLYFKQKKKKKGPMVTLSPAVWVLGSHHIKNAFCANSLRLAYSRI